MTLEEVKDKVAVKHGFENFEQVRTCLDVGTLTANTAEDILDQVANEYACGLFSLVKDLSNDEIKKSINGFLLFNVITNTTSEIVNNKNQ